MLYVFFIKIPFISATLKCKAGKVYHLVEYYYFSGIEYGNGDDDAYDFAAFS